MIIVRMCNKHSKKSQKFSQNTLNLHLCWWRHLGLL